MSKNLVGILIGLLVAVGVGGYLIINKNTDNKQALQTTNNTNTKAQNENDGTEMQGSLQSLRSDGKARECTMKYSDSNGSGSGKMYTDGRGRGRITLDLVSERGNAGQSNTLTNGDKTYSWTTTAGGSFGFVFDTSTIQTKNTGSPTSSSTAAAGKDFDLKCKDWSVDEAVLMVPLDVKFTPIPASQ